MPRCTRYARRRNRRTEPDAVVVRERQDCFAAHETIAEDFYNVPGNNFQTLRCCDSYNGCGEYDTRRRCEFWPGFAHPRWLTCTRLNNGRCR